MDTNEKLFDAVYTHDIYGESTPVKFDLAKYRNNGTLAVMLTCKAPLEELDSPEAPGEFTYPYATVTVNLPESDTLAEHVQFVDENNIPGVGEWLQRNGIATPTDIVSRSGFCTYRAYEFNIPRKMLYDIRQARTDIVAGRLIEVLEKSGLKPDEVNPRGELYSLKAAGDYPNPRVIVYKGTDPEHLGAKPDIFLLAIHRTKGEQMWRLSNLPDEVRSQVIESVNSAVKNAPRLKM